ncbi:MAG TPA: DUF1801 domain-containing protein [Phnomibacter sp.]|nr:DUF1801 domain-containing protein [Phnomibacter sp.]
MIPADIITYNTRQSPQHQELCTRLSQLISQHLAGTEGKIWHAHPVWFIQDNPIVGYSIQKKGVRLMFWSGASFDEPALHVLGTKFKDASIFYNQLQEVEEADLQRWLQKSQAIQWDYKNLIKRKGRLERLG